MLQYGNTALHLACKGGHKATASMLLQHSVDVEARDGVSGVCSNMCRLYGGLFMEGLSLWSELPLC